MRNIDTKSLRLITLTYLKKRKIKYTLRNHDFKNIYEKISN